jgi:hypothetical protein
MTWDAPVRQRVTLRTLQPVLVFLFSLFEPLLGPHTSVQHAAAVSFVFPDLSAAFFPSPGYSRRIGPTRTRDTDEMTTDQIGDGGFENRAAKKPNSKQEANSLLPPITHFTFRFGTFI